MDSAKTQSIGIWVTILATMISMIIGASMFIIQVGVKLDNINNRIDKFEKYCCSEVHKSAAIRALMEKE